MPTPKLKPFRLMKGVDLELNRVRYPLLVSPKIDGIRAGIRNGQPLTNSLKLIPNRHVQSILSSPDLEGLDGELVVGDPTHPDCYNRTQSGIMSQKGEPDFRYIVFDHTNCLPEMEFEERLDRARALISVFGAHLPIFALAHELVDTQEKLVAAEQRYILQGYEGLVARAPRGLYKYGRATVKEGWMLKMKTFEDSEAEVVGYTEQMHNGNEAITDERGLTKRSSAAAGKVGKGTLGTLVCVTKDGVKFEIGTFKRVNMAARQTMWDDRESLIGKIVKFQHMPYGAKEAPRLPRFIGFRHPDDM